MSCTEINNGSGVYGDEMVPYTIKKFRSRQLQLCLGNGLSGVLETNKDKEVTNGSFHLQQKRLIPE